MYLDTNILIYLFERHEKYSGRVADELDNAAKTGLPLITSVITVTEFLAGTVSSDLATLQKVPDLQFVALTENLAEQAALLKRENNLQIGDAIHLATAIASKTEVFFTNDRHLTKAAQKYLAVKHL